MNVNIYAYICIHIQTYYIGMHIYAYTHTYISTNKDDWIYLFKLYSPSQNPATVDHSKLSRQVDVSDSEVTL